MVFAAIISHETISVCKAALACFRTLCKFVGVGHPANVMTDQGNAIRECAQMFSVFQPSEDKSSSVFFIIVRAQYCCIRPSCREKKHVFPRAHMYM